MPVRQWGWERGKEVNQWFMLLGRLWLFFDGRQVGLILDCVG